MIGVAAISLVLAALVHPREPVHESKPLSYWVEQLQQRRRIDAELAMRRIGPKAIPVLLAKIKRHNSRFQILYRKMWPKLPANIQQRLRAPSPPKDELLMKRIAFALSKLGTPAIPGIIGSCHDPDANVRLVTVDALRLIGAEADTAIPTLIQLVHDPNAEVRNNAVSALYDMGPKRSSAIPDLICALHDTDIGPQPGSRVEVRATAAMVLGLIGPEAHRAAPELTRLLTDAPAQVRYRAATALSQVLPGTNAVPLLIEALEKVSDLQTCVFILDTLGGLGRSATSSVPAIVAKMAASPANLEMLPTVLENLRRIDPEAAAKLESEPSP